MQIGIAARMPGRPVAVAFERARDIGSSLVHRRLRPTRTPEPESRTKP
jgi:hypothetical protein